MRKLLTIILLFGANILFAQKAPAFAFSKITESDLKKNVYAIDSNAAAVVLADVGKGEIVGNEKNWFHFVFIRHKRVHVLNEKGYKEAEITIPLYITEGKEEKLSYIKATTYNLENGKQTETKLDKTSVFTERLDKNNTLKKIALPAVRAGSIIDVEYKIESDFLFNLQPWAFQASIPVLWSEYNLALPEFLGYLFLKQGHHPFFISEKYEQPGWFRVSDSKITSVTKAASFNANVLQYRWAMKDVPALRDEDFVFSLNNYVSKIDFQLSEYRYPLPEQAVMKTWEETAKEMMERQDFGAPLLETKDWLDNVMRLLHINGSSPEQKAKSIFVYVRDSFFCTNSRSIYTQQKLQTVAKTKKGNLAEINLLLIAMLRHAGLSADPVLLSTRKNGFAYDDYPIISRFNYVVCRVEINGKNYFLDASEKELGFGQLPNECYNGWARIINENAKAIDLSADSLTEKKISSLVLQPMDGKWLGNFIHHAGEYESYEIRKQIKQEGEDRYFENLRSGFNVELRIDSSRIDSLHSYDNAVTVNYKFSLPFAGDDVMYLNPMLAGTKTENPFFSLERNFPVEMPYTINETYVATIYVPQGYEVEQLPQQVKVKLNDVDDACFEYAIGQSGSVISLRSTIKLDRAYYMPEEYQLLRKFFDIIVEKHKERIVLRKK